MPQISTFHPSVQAAFLYLGAKIVPNWSWPQSMQEICELSGSGRSQAYAMVSRLQAALANLLVRAGRPVASPSSPPHLQQVTQAVLDYLLRHPGSASYTGSRRQYRDGFRHFVIGLVGPGQPAECLSIAELSEATQVPIGTLKEWLGTQAEARPEEISDALEEDTLRDAQLKQIVDLYRNWRGTFKDFCQMVRGQYRLNYGATFIGNLLQQLGLRDRKSHRSNQAPWSRDTFLAHFPGAQWLGDGTGVQVYGIDMTWENQAFNFNLEVILDVASNALVGMAISDFEDQDVVLKAYANAVENTGSPPMSLSLDNRISNHTEEIKAGLDKSTTLLASTLGRGQAKAPLEGAFGNFKQEMLPLCVAGANPREQARSVLGLVFWAWSIGRNGRPRKKLGNLSPIDSYNKSKTSKPTPEEVEAVSNHIQYLARRQQQLRQTLDARADQVKVELLKQGLAELAIDDPNGRLALCLSRFSRDAIVEGLAIFKTKSLQGTLPAHVLPGRYLGGIIKNRHSRTAFEIQADEYIRQRERLNDLSLRHLTSEFAEMASLQPWSRLDASLKKALSAEWAVDYHFWAAKCVDALASISPEVRLQAYKNATKKIAASFQAHYDRRQSLLGRLSKAATEI